MATATAEIWNLAVATWYVVHTKPRAEWMVYRALLRLGYDAFYPHELGTVRHARRKIGVLKPLFPRYLFVGVEPLQGLYDVNTAPGVSTVIYGTDGPAELMGEDLETVERLRKQADENGCLKMPKPTRKSDQYFEPGQIVRIIEGPLQGLTAKVEVDNDGQVRVWLDEFRGVIQATVPSGVLAVHPQGGLCAPRTARLANG